MMIVEELNQIQVGIHTCVVVNVPTNFEETQTCVVVFSNRGKLTTHEAKLDCGKWAFVSSSDFGGYIRDSHPASQKLKRLISE